MKNILDDLYCLLKLDERFISAKSEILRNKIRVYVYNNDEVLLKALLTNKKMREHFFIEVAGTTIFEKEKFMHFIEHKEFLPDSYTAFKNKIGLTQDGEHINSNRDVVLSWPYKDCILEGGMTKENRRQDEIFLNEILGADDVNRLLDAKVFTNFKRVDEKGEHKLERFRRDVNGTIKDNLILKGNNLLALHSLERVFREKVKLIYIDPPYNTGNDSFTYNDRFNHSTWLTFMKNRLTIAKSLLRDDGVIVVSCDDNEQAYLKVLADEIFKSDNFIVNFVWETKKGAQGIVTQNMVVNNHENLLVFGKNREKFRFHGLERDKSEFQNMDNDPRGSWKRQYLQRFGQNFSEKTIGNPINGMKFTFETPYSQEKLENWIEEGRIIFPEDNKNYPARKEFLCEYNNRKQLTSSLGLYSTKSSTEELYKLFANEKIFKNPKPEKLIAFIIEQSTQPGDIVLDYHLGSGTTAAVAHKMGRQYIGIEQMDYIENITCERLKKVIDGEQGGISKSVDWQGGGDFVYLEIAKWNEAWREKVENAKNTKEIIRIWEDMKKAAFLSYKVDIDKIDANVDDFAELPLPKQKEFLWECLDKNHLYINYSEIEDKEYGVTEGDRALNKEFYGD